MNQLREPRGSLALVARGRSCIVARLRRPEWASGAGASGAAIDVGVSNTLQGNGWREQMICSIKAEAKTSGKVAQGHHREPQHGHRRPDRGHARA